MQAILLHALAVHAAAAAGHLSAPPSWRVLAGGGLVIPDPAPSAPPGLIGKADTVIAWGKWGVLICGVGGLLIAGGMMAIGHRNRSSMAADGAARIPWVVGGLSLVAASAAIVAVFL
jgi:hypothetical protein